MKKRFYFGAIGVFVVISYVWFAVLPECTGFTLPTGGWDWLGFSGVIFSVAFAVWGVCKQIEISNQQTKDQIASTNEQVKKQIIASNEQIERQITASNEQTERQISASNEQIRLQIQENLQLMLKQQQLSVVPCLDVNPYVVFDSKRKNNVFRFFTEANGGVYNGGYHLPRTPQETPKNFQPRINIHIRNVGLSVAMGLTIYLYELTSVDGLEDVAQIPEKPISNFYEKVHFKNYVYYEDRAPDAKPISHDWIITPEYNISPTDDEVNLVFDCSRVNKGYHSIIKFSFCDIYKNEYYQLMYVCFDQNSCSALPISKLFTQENPPR